MKILPSSILRNFLKARHCTGQVARNMACQDLTELSLQDQKSFFNSFDTVLTDCDGVLWSGNTPIPGSVEMIHKFREMGKKVIYVTNNATRSRKEYVTKMEDLGFGGTYEEIFTPSFLVASYLRSINFNKKVYLYGFKGIAQELTDAGIDFIGLGPDPVEEWSPDLIAKAVDEMDPDVGCVIASLDYYVSYLKMLKAVTYLNNPETIFLVTNLDERFPFGNGMVLPGTGSVVQTLITASRRKPIIVGKPEKFMFEAVQKEYPTIQPGRTLMIGDNTKTDIMLGKNCGLQTLFVDSGVDRLTEVRGWKTSGGSDGLEAEKNRVPDFFANKLGDLLPLANSVMSS